MLSFSHARAGADRRMTQEKNALSSTHHAAPEQAAGRAGRMTAHDVPLTSEELLDIILTSLEDDKAEEIVKIDLKGKSSMADYMVIASGRSTRQVAAISDHLADKLKQEHGRATKMEGKDTGDWVLIDTGDVIVHVFRPEVREFYQLEKMWQTPARAAN